MMTAALGERQRGGCGGRGGFEQDGTDQKGLMGGCVEREKCDQALHQHPMGPCSPQPCNSRSSPRALALLSTSSESRRSSVFSLAGVLLTHT